MLLASLECPRCKVPLPHQATAQCPRCGTPLDKLSTHRVRDLDVTTEFTADEEGSDEEISHVLVGSQLGNYQIEKFLGQGGMAAVYLARHLTLERPCAIKVLKPSVERRDHDAVASFLGEARAAANLIHPNVVTIHTIGQDRQWHYIEMEYIDGTSLAALQEREGCFSPAQATCFLTQISSALAVAHKRHLIHRDIKPGNVMVDRDRRAKLADFGLAKRVHDRHTDEGGWLSGTPNFMAPELFDGLPATTQSDVYAMGVTYYLLLTGRLPVSGDSLTELMQWHRTAAPPDVREVSPEIPDMVAETVARCLAKDPRQRFANAVELHAEIRSAYGALRSLESLLTEALEETSIVMNGSGNQYELVVPLPGGRKQHVQVQSCTCATATEQIVRVYSVCGPADSQHYQRALELNPKFPYGAIGLEDVDGAPHFVMTNAFLRARCDPNEVRQSILGIARHADEGERFLTGLDQR